MEKTFFGILSVSNWQQQNSFCHKKIIKLFWLTKKYKQQQHVCVGSFWGNDDLYICVYVPIVCLGLTLFK